MRKQSSLNSLLCADVPLRTYILTHVNIPGNEKADVAAKSALSLPITNMKLPAYDLIPRVFPSFVLKNGRISGNVARAINFMPSTQL